MGSFHCWRGWLASLGVRIGGLVRGDLQWEIIQLDINHIVRHFRGA